MKLLRGTRNISKSIPKMSLYQLPELAPRQPHDQIDCTQRLFSGANNEQRINYLTNTMIRYQNPQFQLEQQHFQNHHQIYHLQHQSQHQTQQHPPKSMILDYDQPLDVFKEKITLQEAKLRELRHLKGQIQKQRFSNTNVCSELETLKLLFKEKERELSVALNKIETLTRQLDEIKKGNITNSYSIAGYKHSFELENLRQELLFKNKIIKQNEEELLHKRNLLYKRKCEIRKVDERINDLQTRLARKKQLNQQLATQSNIYAGLNQHETLLFGNKSLLRNTNKIISNSRLNPLSNVATVEPLPRFKIEYDYNARFDYGTKKLDPKYQTLPYNTKFNNKFKTIASLINQEKVNIGDNLNELQENYTNNSVKNIINNNNTNTSNDNNNNNNDNTNNNNNNCSSAAKNNISLIINTKDDSFEERPSPSGSSGSSDRISSSMAIYSFNEKLNYVDIKYKDLSKKSNENIFPHSFVPNTSTTTSAPTNLPNETTNSKSSECNSNLQKTKPSVPVKPIASTNNKDDDNKSLMHKDSIIRLNDRNANEKQMAVKENNNTSDVIDNSNCRSSVSEIVYKLENFIASQESWEKMKRRPVFSSNEVELELQKCSEFVAANTTVNKPELSNINDNNECNEPKLSVNVSANNDDLINDNVKIVTKINHNNKEIDSSNDSAVNGWTGNESKLSIKHLLKGNLKTAKNNDNKANSLGRRVSFDPLALLLDASLEGELELVKKTATQVPNPSSSNDEGITALHNATCAGHFDIVQFLIEIGCDVNVQDSDGWTPLHCAASCNNLPMIKFLVKSGACIFATTFSDRETAAEKCEEDEEGFDGCSQYLYGIQEKLGILNNGIVYALYDYESQNEDELSFKEGDTIKVLKKGDEREKEWWWSTVDNKEGYIPRNLVGLYSRIHPKEQQPE